MQLSPLSSGGEHISRSNPIAGFDDAQCTYDGDLFRDPAFRTLDFHKGMEITGDTPRSPFRFKRWLKFLIILIVLYSKKCSYELQIFEAVPLQMWDGKNSRVLTWNIYRTAGQVLKQISYIFQHRTGVRYYPWSPFPMGRRISKSPRCTYIARWWFQMCFIFTPIWGNDPIWLIFRRSGSKPLASGSAGPPGGCYSSRELGDPSKKHQALAGAALLWSSVSCETFVPWYFLHCLELGRDQLRNQTAH